MSENELSADKPPYGNTGAQNTYREGLRACVDWVSATLKSENLNVVFDVLNMSREGFVEMEHGRHGYKKHLRKGHISILYDGTDQMGIHVEMSGQGCREFERDYPYTWAHFFFQVFKHDGGFSRLDAAIDDFKGYFSITELVKRVKRGEAASKFKSARHIEKIKVEKGVNEGSTLYFGSPKSRIKIRFYDKLQERIGAGKEIEDGIDCWNRSEVELRDERADAFAMLLYKQYENSYRGEEIAVGKIVSGILKNYINFLKPTDDSNKARWPVAMFWSKFLGDVEKVKLAEIAPDKTLEETKQWFEKQIPKTMGKIFLALNSDIDYFVDLLNKGMEKLEKKDFWAIEHYKQRIREAKENEHGRADR